MSILFKSGLLLKAESGGGTGGTTNYNDLNNKPSINNVTLTGNKTSADLGIKTNYTFSELGIPVSGVASKSFLASLTSKNLPSGSVVVGGVAFTDFPTNSLYNAELTVTVKDSTLSGVKVYDMTLSSTNVAPYVWNAAYRTDEPGAALEWVSGPLEFTSMPEPDSKYAGKIMHYVGGSIGTTYVHGYYYECVSSGGSYIWQQVNVQPTAAFLPLPDDMWRPERKETGQSFSTTEDFCEYFVNHYSGLAVAGNCFLGTVEIRDTPSEDWGGELTLQVFGEELFQLDFYSTNTEPHHWYCMYYNGSLQFSWMGTWDLKQISGYNASTTQTLKNVNGTFAWVNG